MTRKSDNDWAEAETSLPAESRLLLRQLREDYMAAARRHVPTWPGGPSPKILSELIRLGWRRD